MNIVKIYTLISYELEVKQTENSNYTCSIKETQQYSYFVSISNL